MKKLHYNSPVILTFFLVSLTALLLGLATGGWTNTHLFSVYRSPMTPLFFVRLFGHVLGHAGWDHFMGNMLLLLVVGPPMEEKYGSKTLLDKALEGKQAVAKDVNDRAAAVQVIRQAMDHYAECFLGGPSAKVGLYPTEPDQPTAPEGKGK